KNYLRVQGDTSTMNADMQWSDVTCDSRSITADAVFSFELSSPTRVALDTAGSAFDTVLALYSAAPGVAPTYTPIPNTNDSDDSAHPLGQVYNQIRAVSGDTSSLTADYDGTQVGCNANTASKDA